jgi:hypothetical protein
VDDLLLLLVEVLEARKDLADDQLGFLLLDLFVFLQVIVQVGPTAELEDCAETIVVDLHCVEVLHHPPVVQLFVDLILTQRVLNVVVFHLVAPAVVKVVDLASHFSVLFEVESLVDF